MWWKGCEAVATPSQARFYAEIQAQNKLCLLSSGCFRACSTVCSVKSPSPGPPTNAAALQWSKRVGSSELPRTCDPIFGFRCALYGFDGSGECFAAVLRRPS